MFLVAILGAVAVVRHVMDSTRVARRVSEAITQHTGAEVRIRSAQIGWGTISLHDLEVLLPGDEPIELRRLLDSEQVLIRHSLLSLVQGRFKARQIRLMKPTIHLTEDLHTGRFNYEKWFASQPGDQASAEVLDLPHIYLRAGRVRLGQVTDQGYALVNSTRVNGKLTRLPDRPDGYHLILKHDSRGDSKVQKPLTLLRGQFDLRHGRFDFDAEHCVFDDTLRMLMPNSVRDHWDRLNPVGSLPVVTVRYNPTTGLQAELAVRDGEMTIPDPQINKRLRQINGRFILADQRVKIIHVTGQIDNVPFAVNGSVDRLDRDAPFEIQIRTDPFFVPERPGYLDTVPMALRKFFQHFAPSGTLALQARIRRTEPRGPIHYNGDIAVTDSRVTFDMFPYPLKGLHGRVRFNQDLMELIDLRGQGPTGARVQINGALSPLLGQPAMHFTIKASDAPIDEVMYQAIPADRREVIDWVLDSQAHQRLIDKHTVQRAEQRHAYLDQLEHVENQRRAAAAETSPDPAAVRALTGRVEQLRLQAGVPVFELGGTVSAIINVDRKMGPQQAYQITTRLQSENANILFRHWPYPLRVTRGQIQIQSDGVVIDHLELQGLTGATGRLSGRLGLHEEGADRWVDPDLELVLVNMSDDHCLRSSLPDQESQWLDQLGFTGVFDATGWIFSREPGQIEYRIDADVHHGRIEPAGSPLQVEQISGTTTLRPGEVQIHSLQGRLGEGEIDLMGRVEWTHGTPRFDLSLEAKALELDAAIIKALPIQGVTAPHLNRWFETHRLTGTVDADLVYRSMADQQADYRVRLRPHQVSFNLHGQPITLNSSSGQWLITPDAIELDRFASSYDAGRFIVSGRIEPGPNYRLDLAFEAKGEQVRDLFQAVFPESFAVLVKGHQLQGAYEINQARLSMHPDGSGRAWTLFADAHLTNASVKLGLPMTEIDGRLSISASNRTGDAWPQLDLRLDAQRLRAAERLIQPLSLRLVSDDRGDRLLIREMQGDCYGGVLLGQGDIQLGSHGYYKLWLTLQDVQLEPFIRPLGEDETGRSAVGQPSQSFSGMIEASLAIEGSLTMPQQRRGRGQLVVRDANLYDVPLVMTTMQLLNLTLPASRSFDRASANYLVEGDRVQFDLIQFEAPTIEIAGTGTMICSSRKLDLDMVTRNPAGPKLGPISDLLKVFKDELISIHVTGTLEDPQPEPRSLQGITQSWQDIFGPNHDAAEQRGAHRPDRSTRPGGLSR